MRFMDFWSDLDMWGKYGICAVLAVLIISVIAFAVY